MKKSSLCREVCGFEVVAAEDDKTSYSWEDSDVKDLLNTSNKQSWSSRDEVSVTTKAEVTSLSRSSKWLRTIGSMISGTYGKNNRTHQILHKQYVNFST